MPGWLTVGIMLGCTVAEAGRTIFIRVPNTGLIP